MKLSLVALLLLFSSYLFGQSFTSSFLINQDTLIHLSLGGLLDGKNCQVPNRYIVNAFIDHQRVPAFEPLDSVVFHNVGNNDIQKFQIIAKDNNIYSMDSIAKQAINPLAQTAQDSLYSIYKYMTDKHFYFYVPEPESKEFKNVTRHIGVYGYGHCGSIANCATLIARKNEPLNQRYWLIRGNSHAISELYFNGKYYYVDADEEMMVKGRNNKDYLSFGEAYEDLYLFYRTKSFGVGEPYSFYNSVVTSVDRYMNFTDHVSMDQYEDSPPCYPNDSIGNYGDELFYSLKSGEKLTLSHHRDSTFNFHHFPYDPCWGSAYGYLPDSSTILSVIYNAKSSYDVMATEAIDDKFSHHENVVFNYIDHTIKADTFGSPSIFELKKESLFPIVNGEINIQTSFANLTDSIVLEVSFDSLNWIHVQTLSSSNNLNHINLENIIDPKNSISKYKIFARCTSYNTSNSNDVLITDLSFNLNYQISRFIYPSLFLGDNPVKINVEGGASNQLLSSFYWKENASNTPPAPPSFATFPSNNSIINQTNFAFTWEQINMDSDGDAIAEWQFQLSEYPDFRTVLSNNFDYYSLGIENGNASFISYNDTTVGANTFFNHNTTYYWRVRLRDQRNAWGDWSNSWKFTVKTTMPIQNIKFELFPLDTTKLLLTWQKNSQDSLTNKYVIINNNCATSLYLHPLQVFYTHTTTPSLLISPDSIHFSYRGFAVDAQNNYSAPSPIVILPSQINLNLHQTHLFTQDMDSMQHPFPNYPSLNRNYFLVFDTTYFQMSNTNELKAIKDGKTMVSICYMEDNDTIYKKQYICNIAYYEPLSVKDFDVTNMFDGEFFIKNSKGKKKEVFNCLGQLVYHTDNEYVNISNFSKGLYFIRMNGKTKKVVLR